MLKTLAHLRIEVLPEIVVWVLGMAIVKATITLDEEDLKKIRGLVAAGKAASISGFVQHAVTTALHDVAGWGAILSGALEQTGGPLKKRERAWADGILAGTDAKRLI